jgi:membrane protein YdbS with pleckstrin-like domain
VLVRPGERVRLDARRHGAVLARPLVRALVLAAGGLALVVLGWPFSVAGALVQALAAVLAVVAVWRWERTRLVVTDEQVFLVQGTLRRRARSVPLERVGDISVEQTLLGRALGYGTLVAGGLEISYVPEPRTVSALVRRA